ncbi:ATP-binding cassette domain-containing protein [Qipengyuania spongiae]|uniref:ABC transporter ATP-binding protein n=1 Tax=Qipengyuania spongiae TaxID=2909673 RepID=A0ABY5SX14_9SPHN|nr:ABC transporter ATP-binding protein [Qipengyuania spongiae]UVI38396.1 ABC transporter ATP-binding protein [Qipengyuania spongiae]
MDGLDIVLPRGQIHAVVGSNGAGKSTFFRMLLGFEEPDEGECHILGRPSKKLTPTDRGRIGFVHEEHTLPAWARVDDVLAVQRSLHSERWNEDAFNSIIKSFRLAGSQRVAQLSRGERAGLNLAMAIGQSPELLIMDEPTLGLDVVARRRLLDILVNSVGESDRTVIYCSHQFDEVERLADTLLVLERGRAVSFSTPDEFCDRIDHWVSDIPFRGPLERDIPGLLQHRVIDGVHHHIVIDQGKSFADFLRSHGARKAEAMTVPLARGVDAYLTRNHAGTAT